MLLAHGMELFAQAGNGVGAGGNANAQPGLGGQEMLLLFCFYGVAIAVGLVIQCFFLNTLSKCFKEIAPRNRSMEPGQVWLCLIPLFGTVWIFITVLRLAESLEKEYRSRGLSGDGDFGKQNGLIYLVLSLIGCCIGLIFWIMYWMKIAAYTKELRERGGGRGRDRGPRDGDPESEDEYRERRTRSSDDDYERRRRRRDEDERPKRDDEDLPRGNR